MSQRRNDLEAIEANLERLRSVNSGLDHILRMIQEGVVTREHGYAMLLEELVESLERLRKRFANLE